MKYQNNDLLNTLLPPLNKVARYIKLANSDDLYVRDVRPLMSVLQRLPQVDPYLGGLMQTRKIALLGFDYAIKYPDDVVTNESDIQKLNEIKRRFQISKMYKIFNSIMNGLLFGMSAVRLQWGTHPVYKNYVEKRINLDLTELDFSLDNDDLVILDSNNKRDDIDKDLHLFVRHNPLEGIVSNYTGSTMRTLMIYIILKYIDKNNWASANEKYADPLRYAQYRVGTDPEEVKKILAGLAQLGSDSYAAFSDDIQVKFLEALRQGIVDMHKEFIDDINRELAIALLGQTLTTEIGGQGSFAAAKVHNFVRQDIMWGDILEFQNIISEQYIRKDFELNYGEPRVAYPVFQFLTNEIEDQEKNARKLNYVLDAGLAIKKDEAYNSTGYTPPAETDEVIKKEKLNLFD